MHHEYDSFLLPLIAISGLGLIIQVRTGLKWIGPNILPFALALIFGILGYFSAYPIPFISAAWFILVFFLSFSSYCNKRLTNSTLNSNIMQARAALDRLHLVLWGRPYLFQRDTLEAISLYMNGSLEAGDELVRQWDESSTPPALRHRLGTYHVIGLVSQHDWDEVLSLLERYQTNEKAIPDTILIAAARAYAEKGDLHKSAQCLAKANINHGFYDPQSIAMTVLPVVSLSGDMDKCRQLIKDLSSARDGLPAYGAMYWRGRCLAAQGDSSGAQAELVEAMKLTENREEASIWKSRIKRQLDRIQNHETVASNSEAAPPDIDEIWKLYRSAMFTREIIAPWKWSKTVLALVIITSAIFVTGKLLVLYGGDEGIVTVQKLLSATMLDPQRVLNGEYYRLITYIFLHKDETHLLVNMVGLLWFGRIAQNIFGTWQMLLIFIFTGIAGGVVHTFVDPLNLSIGASGGLMGIFGAVCTGMFRLRTQLPPSVARRELTWLLSLAIAGAFMDRIVPQIAMFVHLGGLLSGAAIGWLFPVRQPDTWERS